MVWQGHFYIYPLPDDPNASQPRKIMGNLPVSAPVECIIRVYIIRAFDLQPSDPNGLVSLKKICYVKCSVIQLFLIQAFGFLL
jgi:hypothetical protein